MASIEEMTRKISHKFTKIRHRLHSIPELGYAEYDTSKLITKTLIASGYSPYVNVGGTRGLTATIDSGRPGKTIAIRAELDALPIKEQSILPYASKKDGQMHACGHDGHLAIVLAVAHMLQNIKTQLNGKVKFIFQPAEEKGTGAQTIIKAGVLTKPKVDAIFGFHNSPPHPLGLIGIRKGAFMLGISFFTITIHGSGGHAAFHNETKDILPTGMHIYNHIQKFADEIHEKNHLISLKICELHAGNAQNVLPHEIFMRGAIRGAEENIKKAQNKIKKIVYKISALDHIKSKIVFDERNPSTINTPLETEAVISTAKDILGRRLINEIPEPMLCSDDFGYYLQKVPGAYFYIGANDKSHKLHTPTYNFNDRIIPIATNFLCHLIFNYQKIAGEET